MGVLVGMTGALIISGVIVVIVLAVLCASIFIVPQQQAYIIERFGKFNKVQFAGIHIRIPFVDRIAMKTNMRVNQLNVQLVLSIHQPNRTPDERTKLFPLRETADGGLEIAGDALP